MNTQLHLSFEVAQKTADALHCTVLAGFNHCFLHLKVKQFHNTPMEAQGGEEI
jgi:hypothetical protein